jgi:hypothetical protein
MLHTNSERSRRRAFVRFWAIAVVLLLTGLAAVTTKDIVGRPLGNVLMQRSRQFSETEPLAAPPSTTAPRPPQPPR